MSIQTVKQDNMLDRHGWITPPCKHQEAGKRQFRYSHQALYWGTLPVKREERQSVNKTRIAWINSRTKRLKEQMKKSSHQS